VEHRHHVPLDVEAERVPPVGGRHEFPGADFGRIAGHEGLLDELRHHDLVDDGHIHVPLGHPGVLLALELVHDDPAAGLARAAPDCVDLHARVPLLELGREDVPLKVVHVGVAGCHHVEGDLSGGETRPAEEQPSQNRRRCPDRY